MAGSAVCGSRRAWVSGEPAYTTQVTGRSIITITKEVLAQMAFHPKVAPNLKTMDARIFLEGLMGLRDEARR
jgi:hypothetical protein